ncbi:hypothetical protein Tco_1146040 [Tanacetum coccineum]
MDVRRIEEEVDLDFLSDAISGWSRGVGDIGESKVEWIVRFPFYLLFVDIVDTGWYYRCNSRIREIVVKYKAEKVCHEEIVKMPLVDLKVLEVRGKRTNVNARSHRSTKVDESKLCDIPVVFSTRSDTDCEGRVITSTEMKVVGIVARAASEFHERNESGVLAVFRQVVIMFKRRHLGLHEVLGGARQGRSGVMRKFFGNCRNNMGNEPILALPEGSDNFVVMRGARRHYVYETKTIRIIKVSNTFSIRRIETEAETMDGVILGLILGDQVPSGKGRTLRRLKQRTRQQGCRMAWTNKWRKEMVVLLARLYVDEAVARHGVHVSSIPDKDGMYIEALERDVEVCLFENLVVIGILTFREAEIGEGKMFGLELELETTKVVVIKERLEEAKDRQKSYADNSRKPLEFEVGNRELLKVTPWKGVVHFGKKGKLVPRCVEPFEILERIGPVVYRLRLPEELSGVHDTFHVSNLKKCLADASLHMPLDEIKIDKTFRFVEEPVENSDREVMRLKCSGMVIVKVRFWLEVRSLGLQGINGLLVVSVIISLLWIVDSERDRLIVVDRGTRFVPLFVMLSVTVSTWFGVVAC